MRLLSWPSTHIRTYVFVYVLTYSREVCLCAPVCVAILNVSVLSTGSYDYFMQKEIFEQPESVINTMTGRVRYDEYKGTPDLCESAWVDVISHWIDFTLMCLPDICRIHNAVICYLPICVCCLSL